MHSIKTNIISPFYASVAVPLLYCRNTVGGVKQHKPLFTRPACGNEIVTEEIPPPPLHTHTIHPKSEQIGKDCFVLPTNIGGKSAQNRSI